MSTQRSEFFKKEQRIVQATELRRKITQETLISWNNDLLRD